MPVEFLSDEEAAAYGRYVGAPTRAELEKMFFLDDADRKLIGRRRGDQHRLGFALQLTTARFVGRFLPDPLEVPAEVIDYLADQLGVADVSQIEQYTERRQTQFDHQDEIKRAYGLREFSAVEAEFTTWVDAQAWNTGDGKKSIFVDGVSWLRTNKVLLPGVTTLTRLIARVRDEATERLHETLYGILSPRQQAILTRLLEVPEGPALTDLQLPEHPETLLAEHALVLHLALRDVAARLGTDGVDVIVDEEGRLHVARLKAMPEPPSLVDLRKRVVGMLPRVDLPELLLEVMGRVPGFEAAFTSVAGGVSKLSDFHVSVAACLTASALNIGYAPVVKAGTAALERARLSHVAQNYLSAETFSLANAPLIEEQAKIGFARKLGGGLVAAIDGMRFVVPVPSIHTRPNRKFFGGKRGLTWLNMINDQGAGLGAKVVTGTVRDLLHMIDVLFRRDGGQRPDIIVTDTGSYSDVVFGLVHLLGMQYRPALADLPDQKGWRIQDADYGPLARFARGKIDLAKVKRHWGDILRVVSMPSSWAAAMTASAGLVCWARWGPGHIRPDIPAKP